MLPIAAACLLAMSAHAQGAPARQIDIPASDLVTALDSLARQSGAQFIYRADQLRGLRTQGVHGNLPADAALDRLLQGTGYAPHRDASGAVVIVKADGQGRATPAPAAPAAPAQELPPMPDEPRATELQAVQVTGSRIPRAQIEGPAPITVINAEQIQADGFTSVPDVLRSLNQNNGMVQTEQSASGADFSPGSQQVDLRGLGPNHSLVLVNGRRIADFPLPFNGRSNFTDISSIPLGMVERIEVLTGSASAIYGSDAISGVVNIILKKKVDGTTLDVRIGDSTLGGYASQRLSLSSGFEHGDFSAVFGIDAIRKPALWAYQRDIQDSTADAPTASSRVARRVFLRTDWYDTYLDPGAAACASLGRLNGGTTGYFSRPRYGDYDPAIDDYGPGYFCGSQESIGYGTITSGRKAVNGYASFDYRINDATNWFADVQLGYQKVEQFRDVRSWAYMAPDGNEEGYFFNRATDQVEYWARQFTPEEMGGLGNGMVSNVQRTFSLTTGLKGSFGRGWDYEASLSHSQYHATVSWPQIVSAAANRLFLGDQLGTYTDSRGNVFPVFDADPSRLYTPLTRAEYDSIAADTTYHPKTRSETAAFTVTQTDLFGLPGGSAGFAGTVEVGQQAYDIDPDPLALEYYYYSWKDSDGRGNRNRWATAGELDLPLLPSLNLSLAGRYDQYRFAGRQVGKFTYSIGIEWRPVDSLLLRGSYGTAFRAPDLHYVFAGEGNLEGSGVDYYRCRTEEAGVPIEDCDYNDEHIIGSRNGNRDLEPETSTSWTAGFVWSPSERFDVSVDYFNISLRNEVEDQRANVLLQTEADCRLGQDDSGDPVDAGSPSCQNAIANITRLGDGRLYGVHIYPINVAREDTDGVDLSAHFRLPTRIGDFRFSGGYTWTRAHTSQQFPGDPVEDQFDMDNGYDIPRTKASASVSYARGRFGATLYGSRLGRLPNYGETGWIRATYQYNASMKFAFTDASQLRFSVVNLFNKMPPKDPTYSSYPYYDISWFDSIGRVFYLEYSYRFGGKAAP